MCDPQESFTFISSFEFFAKFGDGFLENDFLVILVLRILVVSFRELAAFTILTFSKGRIAL